jgi:hypothetical protein
MNLKIKNAKLVVPLAIILILLLTIILIFRGSLTNNDCQEQDMNRYTSGMNFPDYKEPIPGLTNALNAKDTLIITVEFAECGEWGGAKEIIRLYESEEKTVMAYFTRDSVCCSRKIENEKGIRVLDDRHRVITIEFQKILSAEDLEILNLFFHRILELSLNYDRNYWYEQVFKYFDEEYGGEEGDISILGTYWVGANTSVKSSSSNFLVEYHNYERRANTWYGKVREQLFGSLLNKKIGD